MKKTTLLVLCLALLGGCSKKRTIEMFAMGYEGCYDRKTMPYTFVVDAHNHFQPFGGPAIDFDTMMNYLNETQVFFVNIFGIGQKLPSVSPCTYYLDCPGTPVTPSISNDFVNAQNVSVRLPDKLHKNIHISLSMSFTDLAKPQWMVPRIMLLDYEYPGMFTWMGEINVVKQALFNNSHEATPAKAIKGWRRFMKILKEREMPVSFHSDLGYNGDPEKYLYLMDLILKTYPDQNIVWVHMGLSKELDKMDPERHLEIMSERLDKYPKLYLDISWRVLYDNYFQKPESRKLYVEFFNKYAERILTGTDFVAAEAKTFKDYKTEVLLNSDILKDVDDNAFRKIALGQNYFELLKLSYKAPEICKAK